MSDEKPVLSRRAAALEPSATLAMTAKAKRLKAEGKDVIAFTVGEPDFKTPAHICAAAKAAIDGGQHGYTAVPGIPPLLAAVGKEFKRGIGVEYNAKEIVVSPGAKFSIYLALQALVGDGDEVIVPAPYWVSYPEMVRLAGGVPVCVPTAAENNFAITAAALEKAITPKTKLLILNSPSNPTGGVAPAEEIGRLAAVLEKRGVWCLSDEIYDQLVYEGAEHRSIASVSDWMRAHAIVVNGVSKTYAMTGWRIGWAAGPEKVIRAMEDWQSQSTSNPCSIAQAAAVAALEGPRDAVKAMVAEFAARRTLIVRLLNDIPGVSCRTPGGAFYALPDISGLFGKNMGGEKIQNPSDFCRVALDRAFVAMVPGEPFGAPAHVRLSYACSTKQIEEGCARLKRLVTGG
jgi:aspartate aminotransferase